MVKMHKFELNSKKIVLDINSGSVHVVDDLIWDIIDLYENNDLEYIVKNLKDKYLEENIREAYEEINTLKENDLLFSEPADISKFKYNEENIVKALCLHVAHDCNLRCNYCFASQGDFHGERLYMPLEVGKKALEFLVKSSGNRRNLEVDFFGGEPLMNFDVVKDLVAYGRELEKEYNKNFRFTITTNGILLDEDNMNFMNENMDNVVLSLDGRKEINDNMRPTSNGKGSFDVITPKFLEFVKLRGDKSYYLRGTFTSKNIDFSKDVLYLNELGFDSISVEPVVASPEHDYALLEEHLEKIMKEYEELSAKYIESKKEGKGFSFFHFMIDLNQGPCFIKRVVGCGAGVEYLAVTPEGDLFPCHQFVGNDDFKIGNIYDGIQNTKLIDEFRQANVFTKEECNGCWARFYCSGGCHANAYNFNKDIKKPYTIGCEMEKKRIECAISIAANLN
ncbi:radical SAM domain-containing protein [Gottschalkia acidurici 9a]|uniref:Radical SAM domain-containing protein n=1 Tax=Gottschalkia acidurici (strain ATCC 7906 / DSM 604 / BCRC 14475 / CIP 104303 / KCTC 5404 / NCIMB 10678 / 9a) TaxID=1128398 RepID=K0B281_GOTA9|nr:thioether cross-link-forming SCIFF peptide maturase [Gottschalkia acidurici]AFS78751.1 radical SAM domain-containing protein [Gottschalkia acidurici 9a]